MRRYAQHKCNGYNISSTFLNHDRHIATGTTPTVCRACACACAVRVVRVVRVLRMNNTTGSAVRAYTSGSEDNCIYIYERESGQVVTQLEGHSSVVHLVDAVDSEPLKLVSSSIENVRRRLLFFSFSFPFILFRADHPCAVGAAVRALSVVPAT